MDKPERKIRSKPMNNFYVPPPARKLQEHNCYVLTDNRSKDRALDNKQKTSSEETKICNNSSLLFQTDSSRSRVNNKPQESSSKKRSRRKKKSPDNRIAFADKNESLSNSPIVSGISDDGFDISTDYMNDNILEEIKDKNISLAKSALIKDLCADKEFETFSDLDSFLDADDNYDNNMTEIGFLIKEVASADINVCDDDEDDDDDGDDEYDELDEEDDTSIIPSRVFSESPLSVNFTSKRSITNHESKSNAISTSKSLEIITNIEDTEEKAPNRTSLTHNSDVLYENKESIVSEKNDNQIHSNSHKSDVEYEWEKLLDNDILGLDFKPSDEAITPGAVRILKPPTREPVIDTDKESYDNSIIEIYGFPEEFKTQDLLIPFSMFVNRGFKLKWVDNTHALGIFPTSSIADEALNSALPFVKTRPLSQASAASKEKAKHIVLPPALRPKTCSALARRLVSGALGVRAVFTKAEREAEREMLKQAREEKRLAARQRDAAWEGKF